MKYYETRHLDRDKKNEIEKFGLYCYDLRADDLNGGIASIEKSVLVNRVGTIVVDKPLPIGNEYNCDYIDYDTFINDGENVSDFLELVDENKYYDYGEIDLSDEEMINYEFEYLFNESEDFDELNKLSINEKKKKFLDHYHNVSDYALIEDYHDKYKLYYIEKEKELGDLER